MKFQKITTFKKQTLLWLLFFSTAIYAQTPTISSFSPNRITHRTSVTINGTNFTAAMAATPANVRFNGVASERIIYLSSTLIRAIVPITLTASGTISVTTSGGTATSASSFNYAPPTDTKTTNHVSRIITDFNGYWNSATASTNPAQQPDTNHSLMAFQLGSTMYSTGSTVAENILNANSIAHEQKNFRALPIKDVQGLVPSNATTTNPNLIVLANKIDGNANAQVPTAPGVAGLSVRDVLIDGIRGLNLGTGVTNLPSTAVLLFTASNILQSGIGDGVPDIMVSQIAQPTDGSYSIYSFVDAQGDVVGNPIQINFSNVPVIGRYKTDFFTLPENAPLNSAIINGSTTVGANVRDIRLLAYDLSDFGITSANRTNAVAFKVMPSGTSDPAFMAYNRDSFQIPSPIITAQPTSRVACVGSQTTFTVTVDGSELEYQWERNGVALTNGGNISGATTSALTINPVGANDVAEYRCLITNPAGAALTNPAYLNTVLVGQTGYVGNTSTPVNACVNATSPTLEVVAQGQNLTYQWYSNTANSNTGGVLITNATLSTYPAPTNTVGTQYYYAVIGNNGQTCAETRSAPIQVNISSPANAGTISGSRTLCSGNTASLSISGNTGTIQWQQSATNTAGSWSNVTTGTGGTTANYTTAALNTTTYYRTVVTNGSCQATSGVATVTVITTNVWTGAVSTFWNTPGNWSCNIVPDLTRDVEIPVVVSNNYPIITGSDGNADCKNIIVASGASITVNTNGNGNLRIAGTITNNGTITATDGTIVMIGTASQTIPANTFATNTVRNLFIQNNSGTTLQGSLNLTGILKLQAGLFTTGNALTLKSNANTTAVIDNVTGSISGTMTVERYIPARRAFRFISSPTTGGTIQSNWQEGAPSTDPVGLGTDITGTGAQSNGFDPSGSNNPSLFTHNSADGSWVATTSTLSPLVAGVPYRLMVRGDRTVNQFLNASPPSNTTLRTTGTIVTGNVTVSGLSQTAGNFSFVGNPYQAPVDMQAVLSGATNLNSQFYYVWDPTQNTRGSYVTVNVNSNTNNVSGSSANKYLQPNHAFFVQTLANGNASLTFREENKFVSSNATPVLYRNSENSVASLRLTMYAGNTEDVVADGFVVNFGANYSNDLDQNDALKPVNQDENIGTKNSGKVLSFESRNFPTSEDIIPIATTAYRNTNYNYKIAVNNFEGSTAYLHDKFNNTKTLLENNAETRYNFTVTSGTASASENRFDIIFERGTLGNGDFKNNIFSIYPNPLTDNSFTVNTASSGQTKVTIYNQLGQEIKCSTNELSSTSYKVIPESQLASGVYVVKITQDGKTATDKLIVK